MSSHKRFTVLAMTIAMLILSLALFSSGGVAARVVSPPLAQADYGSPTAMSGGTAQLRVVHAASDLGDVEVYANDNKIVPGLPYTQYSGLVTLAAGDYVFKFAPVGAGEAGAVITQSGTLAAGNLYTLLAIGTHAKGDLAGIFEQEDVSGLNGGRSRIRVTHAADGVSSLDVYSNGIKLISNLAYGKSSDYLELDATVATIDARLTGSNTPISTLTNLKVESDHIYHFIAVGLVNDPNAPFGLLLINYLGGATPAQATPTAMLGSTTPAIVTPTMTMTSTAMAASPTALRASPTAMITPTAMLASPTLAKPTPVMPASPTATRKATATPAPLKQPTAPSGGGTVVGLPHTGNGDGSGLLLMLGLGGLALLIAGYAVSRRTRRA